MSTEDRQKSQVYSVLAILYDDQNKLNEDFNAAKTALELDPDHPMYQNQFEEFLERMGQ